MQSLEDTQNEPDRRNLAIDSVGVRNLRHPVNVVDRSGEAQATVALVSMGVSLVSHLRGTHMSRFVAILTEQAGELNVKSIGRLPGFVAERLQAEAAQLAFEFPYFITKRAPVTGAPGVVDYQVRLEAQSSGCALVVTAPLTTLCPCSRNISDRGAHNQRGQVTLRVTGSELPYIEDLIDLVESCGSSAVYSLLKRPDEKHVTELAYDNPVFVEDLARNVAMKVRKLPRVESFRIEAVNFESIHHHDAYAIIER